MNLLTKVCVYQNSQPFFFVLSERIFKKMWVLDFYLKICSHNFFCNTSIKILSNANSNIQIGQLGHQKKKKTQQQQNEKTLQKI